MTERWQISLGKMMAFHPLFSVLLGICQSKFHPQNKMASLAWSHLLQRQLPLVLVSVTKRIVINNYNNY